jgi:hypothetical protein
MKDGKKGQLGLFASYRLDHNKFDVRKITM